MNCIITENRIEIAWTEETYEWAVKTIVDIAKALGREVSAVTHVDHDEDPYDSYVVSYAYTR